MARNLLLNVLMAGRSILFCFGARVIQLIFFSTVSTMQVFAAGTPCSDALFKISTREALSLLRESGDFIRESASSICGPTCLANTVRLIEKRLDPSVAAFNAIQIENKEYFPYEFADALRTRIGRIYNDRFSVDARVLDDNDGFQDGILGKKRFAIEDIAVDQDSVRIIMIGILDANTHKPKGLHYAHIVQVANGYIEIADGNFPQADRIFSADAFLLDHEGHSTLRLTPNKIRFAHERDDIVVYAGDITIRRAKP